MNAERRILVAIDDSDASMRAVRYVAQYLGKDELVRKGQGFTLWVVE